MFRDSEVAEKRGRLSTTILMYIYTISNDGVSQTSGLHGHRCSSTSNTVGLIFAANSEANRTLHLHK